MNGQLCTRFGYRKVMCVSLVFMAAFIFITFFANSLAVLLVGQILCGFSWGVFATVGPSYASEVCPTNLRAYLTTYVNLCWAIGQFIAAGVMESLINRPDQWSYRIPFAIQWIWPVPLIVGCYLMPESPWYLVGRDRIEDAKRSLRRLTSNRSEDELNGQLAMMLHTIKIETEITTGTNYFDCFKGTDLRRTEIACLSFAGQILSGSTFAYVSFLCPVRFRRSFHLLLLHRLMQNIGPHVLFRECRPECRRRLQAEPRHHRHCLLRHHRLLVAHYLRRPPHHLRLRPGHHSRAAPAHRHRQRVFPY